MDGRTAARALIEAGRRLGARGLISAGEGNLSIRLADHAARPDIQAVAHAHLPASLALTLAGEVPDPAALPETALLLPRLPLVPLAAMGSHELASAVAAAFADGEPRAGAVVL